MSIENILSNIDTYKTKYIDFLCKICAFEAKATDKQALDAMADFITAFAISEGLQVTRTNMEKCGDFLTVEINPGATKACLFLAHMDTVHEKGTFGTPPVKIYDDRIVGPGVIDCKGGIAIALLTMKTLLDAGYQKHIRLILTSDEEISNILGGAEEINFIRNSAAGFPCAINCETAENDEVVVARKGIIKYRLDIKGVSGHSGKRFFESKNAIVEAAHKIIALHNQSQPGGTTYSCNIIHGGTVPNIIPDSCSVTVDIRAVTPEDIEIVRQTVEKVATTAYIDGTTCEAVLLSIRPPMYKNKATEDLFDKLLSVCHKHDLGSLTPIHGGGGSDSCYTQAAGVASICGLGASGKYQHTPQEYVIPDSIPLRAKILTAFLLEHM